MRLGILGGTFDPVHNGHVAVAEAAADCAQLDELVFVPTGSPPHRPPAEATPAQRLEMCKLAIAGDPRFAVSDVEVTREGPSYTVDTLLALRGANPHAELFLVLGWDAASQLRSWHRPDEVLALAPIVAVSRPGRAAPGESELKSAGLDPRRIILCARPTPAVSGSEIRRALAAGRSIGGMVPPAVERYISAHHLYRA
ncbi:MAG TPA: nicotinate-nucleotide adenylyltransferase [Candidatus Dormibacteraeota bacterium]|nr:nicotinate-nucleotide adenylyltransferase [Candidatus Dormibacteraeota bacterium]